ncbi:MAG: prepilin-type N-terminal cleavage/methylation domain-containing protein [Armatimonadota bacterium]
MSSNPRRRGAFTLVEAIAAAAIVGLGVAAVFGGIAALLRAEARALEAEELQRFAYRKFLEYGKVVDPATAEDSGTFEEEGRPEIAWSTTVEPSETEYLSVVRVTASKGAATQSVEGLVADSPSETTPTGATP